MTTPASHTFNAACNAFVQQMVLHHERGDYYPHAPQVAAELGFSPAQTAAVLGALREYGWIAPGPYGPEETRITARGWDCLEHHHAAPERAAPLGLPIIGKHASEKAPAITGVSRIPVSIYATLEDQCPKRGR